LVLLLRETVKDRDGENIMTTNPTLLPAITIKHSLAAQT
jgi:hypothetical protein